MKKHERSPGGERLVCQLKLRRDGEREMGNGLEINHNEEVEGCGKKRGPFFRCDAFVSEAEGKKLEIKECPDTAAPLKPDRREERWQHAVIFLLFLIKGTPSTEHKVWWRKQQNYKEW